VSVLTSFTFGSKKITNDGLAHLNLLAAVLHLIQAAAILILSNPLRGLRPITTSFLTEDTAATALTGHGSLVTATHRLFDLNIAYIVAAFFIINAISHLLAAIFIRKRYESDLAAQRNHIRWYDFAVSSGLMILALALIAGVTDVSSLFMMLGLTVLMALATALIDINRPIQFNFWLGISAGILPWIVILIYFIGSHIWGSALPAYIYLAAIFLFLMFGAIAANLYLQYKRLGHWESYVFGERTYIVLSFVAKSVLGWLIFFGTLK
jgi:hypothetical protein